MEKLQFKVSINAPVSKVFDIMLGINNKSTYEQWAAVFNPTSSYEGDWNKGSKIYFIGIDENGKKGGMVSEIVENQPTKFVSIKHNGILDGETEILTGEIVEQWAGGHENYTFLENNGTTTVSVEIDSIEEYVDYFKKHYPLALEKLKEICEV